MTDYPDTILPNSELRLDAREQLSGEWTQPVLLTLVYFLVTAVAGIIPLVPILIAGPLGIGICLFYLKFVRDGQPEISVLFDGFQQFAQGLVAALLIGIIVCIGAIFLIVPGIIAALGLSQTFFIIAENPGISATDAMQESWDMMKGHKLQLFLLQLSFLPWALLSVFTLFIGLLWLIPYIYVSYTNFYLEVSGQDTEMDVEDHLVDAD